MESSIYGRTTFKQFSNIDHISDTLEREDPHCQDVKNNNEGEKPTLVTSARDTNPLSLTSMASHILRLSCLASGVLAQGSLALILSQLMIVTLPEAIVTPGEVR